MHSARKRAREKTASPQAAQRKAAPVRSWVHSALIQRAIEHPASTTLTHDVMISLQRTHGNHFVASLIQRAFGEKKRKTPPDLSDENDDESDDESENEGDDESEMESEDESDDEEWLSDKLFGIKPQKSETTESMPFYDKLASILKKAREGDVEAQEDIEKLAEELDDDSDLRDRLVRVKETLSGGAVRASGLDELFKTEKTSEWLRRAAGLKADAIKPVSYYHGKPFDWMDAQRYVRVKTELVMWRTEKGELAGHTGALTTQGSKWKTTGMGPFHEARNEVINTSKTPREGVINALDYHLKNTIKDEQWQDTTTTLGGKTVASKTRALADPGDPYTDEVKRVLDTHRKQVEDALAEFKDNSSEKADISKGSKSFSEFGAKLQKGGDWTKAAEKAKERKPEDPPPSKRPKLHHP